MPNIWGYIKNYKWRSVYFSYFKIIIIGIIIPFILFNIIIFIYYNNVLKNEITSSNMQSLMKTRNTIDVLAREMEKFTFIVSSNEYVHSFITLKEGELSGFNVNTRTNAISSLLSNFIITNDYMDSIYIYNSNTKYIFSIGYSGYLDNVEDKEWYAEYEKKGTGNFVFTRTIKDGKRTFPVLTICRDLQLNNKNDGLLIYNIDLKKLENSIHIATFTSEDNFYIVDNNGAILYSKNNMPQNIKENPAFNAILSNNDNQAYIETKDKNNIYFSLPSEVNTWRFISSVSTSAFSQKMRNIRNILIISVILALIISLLLALIIAMRLYKSITNIIALFQTPEEREHSNNDNAGGSFNEILYICNNIMKVMESNKKIEDELSQKLNMLRKTQSIALQTQINPHFLFNTLQMVNLIIMHTIKEANDATLIISLLSDLLRITLDTKDYLIPVSVEVEHAQKYLQIQSIRYEKKFEVEWDLAPETLTMKTVKLVLQPLIENSIRHGLKPMRKRGKIKISAKIQGGNLVLSVWDNGVGMNKEGLEKVHQLIEEDIIRENDNIGLSNVNQRIKLICGDKFGLTITSEENNGTEVTLTMGMISTK